MPEINILEKNIDQQALENSILSIQVSLDGFSFCIYDLGKKKFTGLRKYVVKTYGHVDKLVREIKEILKKDDLLKIRYKETKFIYPSQKSTLIPSAYFDKTKLKAYFEFNHTLNELDEIHYNHISKTDAYNIFALPTYIAAVLNLPGIKFYHQATPFINSILASKTDTKEQVFVNLNRSFFDIAVISSKGLVLYNSFTYQQESDLLYFVLYVYNQLELSPQYTELTLSGEDAENALYFNALKSYITFVRYNSPGTELEFTGDFDRINKYSYLNLFNIINCV